MKNNIEKYLESVDFYVRFVFILISLLSMSSIIYNFISPIYRILTLLLIGVEMLTIYVYFNREKYDKKIICSIFLLILANIISALINYRYNLFGNLIEVLFMFSYCFIFIMYNPKTIEKIFKSMSWSVQIVSFIYALFGIILLLTKVVLVLGIGEKFYFYGFYNGRLWGLINPNASAILSYISIGTGLLLLISGVKYKRFLKINIIINFIYFALQQSRGAILSVVVMIFLYFIFTSDKKLPLRVVFSAILGAFFVLGMLGINYVSSLYIESLETRIVNINTSKINEADKLKDIEEDSHIRITDSTPSGRTVIWKQAFKMGNKKPIFGFGNRNLREHYSEYFDKYLIENSLNGGGFHNIFITVYVSTGLVGLLSFLILIFYSSLKFLKYLLYGHSKYTRIVIILFYGILFGQLFESQIMYSTNFINIIFWSLFGYGLFLLNKEKEIKYIEIKDVKELQNIELNIMNYIHEICEKIGVKYYLAYGTLIGAIRHRGFIPWDDDLDICMLRDDYEKFQDYLINNPDENFKVMSYLNNYNYVYPFMKVIDSNTYLVEDDVRIDSNMGVYVDIFPIDGYSDDREFNIKMTNLIKKRQLSCYTFSGISNKNSILDTIVRYIFVILFSVTDTTKYVQKIDELAKSRKIDDFQYANYLIYKDMNKPNVDKRVFMELEMGTFCDNMYYIPKHYDELLRSDYGDYMQLPPIEQQKTHHNFKAWKIVKNNKV